MRKSNLDTGMAIKLSVVSRVNVASAAARPAILICRVRSLIERAEENSSRPNR